MNQPILYPYKRINLFIERLDVFKDNDIKFKPSIGNWKFLNDEQYNKIINDFQIINTGYTKYIFNNDKLMANFPNYRFVIAMLLIHNKYATLEECHTMNMFLKSQQKIDYHKKIWSIISRDLI
jgi:hypothetical protein